jgi:DNA transformation protein and related proteins
VGVAAEFHEYVVDLFSAFGPVTVKRMFGGAGIYHKDRMFGLIGGDRIYLKANDETRPAFEAEGSKPFAFQMKGGESVMTGYFELPSRLLDDPDELAKWARNAYEVAVAARGKKKKPRPNTPPADLPLVAPRKRRKS